MGVPRKRKALYRTLLRAISCVRSMAVLIDVYRFRSASQIMNLLAQPDFCSDSSPAAISGLTHRFRRDDKPSKTPEGKDSMSFPLRFLVGSISTSAAGGNRATAADEGCGTLVTFDAPLMARHWVSDWSNMLLVAGEHLLICACLSLYARRRRRARTTSYVQRTKPPINSNNI